MSNLTGVTSFFPTANEGFATTLGSPGITSGAATVPLAGTTGLTNGSIFVGIIEPGATNQQVFTGTVDTVGSQITGVIWTRGANVAHTTGVAIVDYVTGTAFNMITTGVLKQHTQAGAHTAITNTGGLTTDTLSVTSNTKTGNGVPSTILNNPYKFSVYDGLSEALGTNVWQKVSLNTKEFDTGTNFDSTTNYRFTAPITGYYLITAAVKIGTAGIGTTSFGTGALYKNGSAYKYGLQIVGDGTNTQIPESQITALIQLNANDYIELWAVCSESSRAIFGGQAQTYMSGFLVSAT